MKRRISSNPFYITIFVCSFVILATCITPQEAIAKVEGYASSNSVLQCDTFKPGADWCRDCGPCAEGEGDCDGDAQCQSGLICAQDVGADYGWPSNRDVCESPDGGGEPPGGGGPCDTFVPGPDWCTDCGPCAEGEGDCDGDAQCQSGLICAQDVGADYGWPSNRDVCESPDGGGEPPGGGGPSNDLPKIIIKADDLKGYPESSSPVTEKWERFIYIIENHNIKASIGIICNSLNGDDQEYINWINSVNSRGLIEFWMHGLTHGKWETDGITFYEFKNTSYEYQKSHVEKAHELAKKRIPLTLVTFGAPFNKFDENTARVLEEDPDIKIWLFGPDNTNLNNLIILHRSPVEMEYPVGNPDFDEFKTKYERNLSLDYIVLQGHPSSWDDHDFNEFERIINYLKGRGSIFMTPVEYFYTNQ